MAVTWHNIRLRCTDPKKQTKKISGTGNACRYGSLTGPKVASTPFSNIILTNPDFSYIFVLRTHYWQCGSPQQRAATQRHLHNWPSCTSHNKEPHPDIHPAERVLFYHLQRHFKTLIPKILCHQKKRGSNTLPQVLIREYSIKDSIHTRSLRKYPIGLVRRRTSRNLRSIALVVCIWCQT
jgi:hypothetical protein